MNSGMCPALRKVKQKSFESNDFSSTIIWGLFKWPGLCSFIYLTLATALEENLGDSLIWCGFTLLRPRMTPDYSLMAIKTVTTFPWVSSWKIIVLFVDGTMKNSTCGKAPRFERRNTRLMSSEAMPGSRLHLWQLSWQCLTLAHQGFLVQSMLYVRNT